ncbi:hypothetical protein [Streptomyces sp. NPDC059874]|uniref:hypothetical protein n=1 Tax=Streptomyces sp. NPDC059874 TaxID=3346983 RepID=UPI003665CF4A
MDSRISGMLQQIARQDVIEIGPAAGVGGPAALAHVAEHYGFEYEAAYRTGHNGSQVLVRMYRDPRPDARAREAATLSAYPRAGNGGAAPGMLPGTLKPLPEAAEAVAHLTDMIKLDVMAQAADKRLMLKGYGMCGALVLVLLIAGMPVGALAGGAALAAFLAGCFKLGAVRRERIARRLIGAGFVPVRDEHGRQRFLRPGRQLPGHANPFAS